MFVSEELWTMCRAEIRPTGDDLRRRPYVLTLACGVVRERHASSRPSGGERVELSRK